MLLLVSCKVKAYQSVYGCVRTIAWEDNIVQRRRKSLSLSDVQITSFHNMPKIDSEKMFVAVS